MAITHANTEPCSSPVLSPRAPPCIFPPLMNRALFRMFWGATDLVGIRAARAIPFPLWVPAVLSLRLPGWTCLGTRGCVQAGPVPTPAWAAWEPQGSWACPRPSAASGMENKAGVHLPADLSRLPPWSIHHFSKAASHGGKPSRTPAGLATGAGQEMSSSSTWRSCCLPGGGCAGSRLLWTPFGRTSQPWYLWL